MTHSKIFLKFAEKHLGSNYKEVLKFWKKLDKLSKEELKAVEECHISFRDNNHPEWIEATCLAHGWAESAVDGDYEVAGWAAGQVTNSVVAYHATHEIIGGVENPVFVPMFDNPQKYLGMTIPTSNILLKFSEKFPEVHTNPVKYLGSNHQEVLKFWQKLDTFCEGQWKMLEERYLSLFDNNRPEWCKAADLARNASEEVVGWDYALEAGEAAEEVTDVEAAFLATRELIGNVPNKVFHQMFPFVKFYIM